MENIVYVKTYKEPLVNRKEILRYAGVAEETHEVNELLDKCLLEVRDKLTYKVCFCEMPVKRDGETLDLGFLKTTSKKLLKNLENCDRIILFAATVGIEIDRLISKYSKISPSKALMIDAIGAERIESLCDAFNSDVSKESEQCTKPRFSPGYGDFSIEHQKDIFRVLDCQKKIGLFLNDSLMMSPSKSVTAIIGIANEKCELVNGKCNSCEKTDCQFRKVESR